MELPYAEFAGAVLWDGFITGDINSASFYIDWTCGDFIYNCVFDGIADKTECNSISELIGMLAANTRFVFPLKVNVEGSGNA